MKRENDERPVKRFKQCTLTESFKMQNDISRTNTNRKVEYERNKKESLGIPDMHLLESDTNNVKINNIDSELSKIEKSLTSSINDKPGTSSELDNSVEDFDLTPPLFEDPDVKIAKPNQFALDNSRTDYLLSCMIGTEIVKPSEDHLIFFKVPVLPNEPLRPFPSTYCDKWDYKHVRFPCSLDNLYPVDDGNGGKCLQSRWDIIKHKLNTPITSSLDLENAIRGYNATQLKRWNFGTLHALFTEILDTEESKRLLQEVVPAIIQLALQLPKLCTCPPPLLKKGISQSITLSQLQIASMLANAFLCTYPRRNSKHRYSEYYSYPDINFNQLFAGTRSGASSTKIEKLKCLFNYFSRINKKEPLGAVTYTRKCEENFPEWSESTALLTKLNVQSDGTIEDNGIGMLQVDFANCFVGGGVLNHGCVQEEIRFLLCPELIISRLFVEALDDNECLFIKGVERFSSYEGYADTFKWSGDYQDDILRDDYRRCCTEIVAMDATNFYKSEEQYKMKWIRRELDKAYCAFQTNLEFKSPVATGNWGCGAFRGNLHLKALIQLMAAAEAKRDVVYFTFGDSSLCEEIGSMYNMLIEKKITVGQLWRLLLKFNDSVMGRKLSSKELFIFINNELELNVNSSTDCEDADLTVKSEEKCKL